MQTLCVVSPELLLCRRKTGAREKASVSVRNEGCKANFLSEMISLQSRVQEYESLLEKASLQVDAETQLAICKAIGKVFTI